jgi:ABC-type branched-subunit amino acid transport system substrate-binding protein
MRPRRRLLVRLVALLGATSLAAAGTLTPASAAAPKPAPTDIGVSDHEIRIAVVADVENSFSPGLNQANVDAVKAFARTVNAKGGIAGRRLVVDFYDSKLSADETRNALVNACERDFALVGTGANFLTDPEPLITCPDKAGRATGIPDLTTFSLDPTYQCSPVSFQILPPDLDCSTMHDAKERYRVQVGTVRYYQQRFGALHGIYVLSGDLESVRDAALPQVAAWTDVGVKQDGEGAYFVSSVAPRSAFTPYMQVLKDHSSTFAYLGVPVESVAAFRQEAKVQGVSTVKAWACAFECYDRTFLQAGGADVDGELVTGTTTPFEEARRVPALARYLHAVGARNADGFGVQAWIAGLLFQQVATAIAKSDGVNGLTRAAFLDGIRGVHAFTAGGILGRTDIGSKVPSPCFVVLQVKDDRFVRVMPKQPATFDCTPSNRRTIELDLLH